MEYRTIAVRLCVAFTFLAAPAFAQQPLDVVWANGRLTVHASEAPLADVIQRVAALTGLEVLGQDKLNGTVSCELGDLPIEVALGRVLTNVNYVVQEIVAADANRPHRLVLRIHSMIERSTTPALLDGPIPVPVLEALLAEEMHDAEDEREVEAADDPDAREDARKDKIAAAQLAQDGAFGTNADIRQLLKLAENYYNDDIRLEALRGLGSRPIEVARKPAIKALGDEVWEIRMAAVDILGRDQDPKTLATLGGLLEKSDDDMGVRVGVLRVLALRADPESAVYLRAVLEDEDPTIRAAAEQILAELDRRARARRQNGR